MTTLAQEKQLYRFSLVAPYCLTLSALLLASPFKKQGIEITRAHCHGKSPP